VTRARRVSGAGRREVPALPDDAAIVKFAGSFRFLSNFYTSPIRIPIAMVHDALRVDSRAAASTHPTFPVTAATVEHAFQALKAIHADWFIEVMLAPTAAQAREIGKRQIPKTSLRPDWDQVRVPIMRELVRIKFEELILRARLLATGERELVEGNSWGDRFWGAVPTEMAAGERVAAQVNGLKYVGENWLGRILMERRSAIRAGIKNERRGSVR
jgi:ribA/ribD-fused uncharacterized protein